MLEFDIHKCTRHCASTEQELHPGDVVYSVLIDEDGEVVRRDFCESAWQGPPEDAIGFWKSTIPVSETPKVSWAPNDVMLHYFEQIGTQPEKTDVRYVLALLMLRRRILRLEETESEGDEEVLVLYCPKNETEYRLPVLAPTGARIEEIQNELAELLFSGDE